MEVGIEVVSYCGNERFCWDETQETKVANEKRLKRMMGLLMKLLFTHCRFFVATSPSRILALTCIATRANEYNACHEYKDI